uniref:LsmAD domain-containing protein n=2 Tax=Octactis speculum TaxID=3111310 RepID=A0A7S2BAA3_9STRA|mmetsp:Transcript_21255/g.28943  ORF Transcript_21255/g.28943 Transcript_21255/m.28943 type:complete len:308 (+) Transcript_21255:18-941(+)
MSTSTKPAKKSGGRGGRSRGGGTEKGKGGRMWERAGKHADPGPSAPSAPRVDGPTKELTPEEYDAQQEQYINGLCRNRFLDNLTAMAGQLVKVQRLDGSVIEGVFHTVSSVKSSEYRIVLKASKSAEPGTEPSGYYTAIIPNCEIVQVIVPDLKLHAELPAGAGAGFATDGDITDGSGGHLVGRELSSVSESWLDPSLDKPETLAEMLRKEKGQGKWDQFEANRKITGHTASFDENLYTTKLDATKISTDMEAKALKIADEIENDDAKNIHVAQERNQPIDKNIDEEDLFSGVLRPTPEVKEEKKKS